VLCVCMYVCACVRVCVCACACACVFMLICPRLTTPTVKREAQQRVSFAAVCTHGTQQRSESVSAHLKHAVKHAVAVASRVNDGLDKLEV
jgi:hypothetical protein